MLVKHLVQHGNSKALVIDKSILQAAGIEDNALFQIIVDSNSGVTIQSVKPTSSTFEYSKNKIIKKHSKMIRNLSNR